MSQAVRQVSHWWTNLLDVLFFRYDFAAELAEADSRDRVC